MDIHQPSSWPTPPDGNRPVPPDKLAEIKTCLFQGQKLQAIKIYRQCMGSSLLDAKSAVERIEAELRSRSPEKFTSPEPGKGCFAAAVAICAALCAIGGWLIGR